MIVKHRGTDVRLTGIMAAIVSELLAEAERIGQSRTGAVTVNWDAGRGEVSHELTTRSKAKYPLAPEV